jgi:enoyl-CoA hydratase/carnithine racemase
MKEIPMFENLALNIEGAVATLCLNRPEKLNALTVAMYAALAQSLEDLQADPKIRAAVLTGVGGNFTSGNDLGDFLHQPPTGPDSPVFRFLRAVTEFRKPLVAAVEGAAVGIGTTVLLHCDFAYAGAGARFALPFVNLGLCPEAASSFLLPLAAGSKLGAELLMLGEAFSAQQAQAAGLINAVVDDGASLERATTAAKQLAAKPPGALAATKRLLREAQAQAIQKAMESETRAFMRRLASSECREALQAFAEKRKPDFSQFEASFKEFGDES